MSLAEQLAAKRGCPVCVRGWQTIAVAALAALIVAAAMLAWHGTSKGEHGA